MIDDVLAIAHEAVARKNKLLAMQAQLREERGRLQKRLETLTAVLAKEEQNVSRLENSSITALFYTMLGTRRERIIKEREEALAARLKHDQTIKELEDVELRLDAVAAEMYSLSGCEEQYKDLFEQKKQRLLKENSGMASRIMELLDGIGKGKASLQEIEEAKAAGKLALAGLDSAMKSLHKAEGWGAYDMLGGGFIATSIKHDHIDDATESVSWAQMELNRFRTELEDVNISEDIVVQVGDFARFADYFFDGLIADWHVQDAIEQSLESVGTARNAVLKALDNLDRLECDTQAAAVKIQEELEKLIVNS